MPDAQRLDASMPHASMPSPLRQAALRAHLSQTEVAALLRLSRHVDPRAERVTLPPRHKYALGFSPAVQRRLASLRVAPPSRLTLIPAARSPLRGRGRSPRRKC